MLFGGAFNAERQGRSVGIGTQNQRNKIADGGIQKCIKWKSLKTEMLNLRSLCPSGTVPDGSGS